MTCLRRRGPQINPPSPTTKSVAGVCTRPNGSPNQSYSSPLLSITSQQTAVCAVLDPAIFSGCPCRGSA